ncbi:unnamed protein product [Dicrocoelium dendriticum]|nr:unnamed protein product [Dicrocoelium dendriticum]
MQTLRKALCIIQFFVVINSVILTVRMPVENLDLMEPMLTQRNGCSILQNRGSHNWENGLFTACTSRLVTLRLTGANEYRMSVTMDSEKFQKKYGELEGHVLLWKVNKLLNKKKLDCSTMVTFDDAEDNSNMENTTITPSLILIAPKWSCRCKWLQREKMLLHTFELLECRDLGVLLTKSTKLSRLRHFQLILGKRNLEKLRENTPALLAELNQYGCKYLGFWSSVASNSCTKGRSMALD